MILWSRLPVNADLISLDVLICSGVTSGSSYQFPLTMLSKMYVDLVRPSRSYSLHLI
jgi:hypothetical protein